MKYNTARVVVWNEFKVMNAFTLETSMFGKKIKKTVYKKNDKGFDEGQLKNSCQQLDLNDFDSIG